MLHVIPDDGAPHAPTTECGCGPILGRHDGRAAIVHTDQTTDEREETRRAPTR